MVAVLGIALYPRITSQSTQDTQPNQNIQPAEDTQSPEDTQPSEETQPTNQELQTLDGHAGWFDAVAWSPDGTTLATSSGDNTTILWIIN